MMTNTPAASFAHVITQIALPSKPASVGDYVGRFGNFGPHCWELNASSRHSYYSDIRPLILAHLDGRIGSISSSGSITIVAYMIGRRASTAAPTVLFVSEC